jgi:hypothetical protein
MSKVSATADIHQYRPWTHSLDSASEQAGTDQFAHMISIRDWNIDRSSWRMTAPGTVSKNAGHPQPELLSNRLSASSIIVYTAAGSYV